MVIELQIAARTAKNKGETKRIRREGKIPCVIYAAGKEEQASLSKEEFQSVIRNTTPGFLSTKIFLLKDQQGNAQKVIVKDVQYDVGNYDVLHLDFQRLDDKRKVNINVPVECKRQADCVGIKGGGFLRQAMRHIPVSCLPKDIPSHFELDIKDLDIGKAFRVKDIVAEKKVKFLANPEEVVVAVIKNTAA